MKKMLGRTICLILCLSVALCGSVAAVTQSEIDELEARRGELQEQQDRLNEQLEALQQGMETSL